MVLALIVSDRNKEVNHMQHKTSHMNLHLQFAEAKTEMMLPSCMYTLITIICSL